MKLWVLWGLNDVLDFGFSMDEDRCGGGWLEDLADGRIPCITLFWSLFDGLFCLF